MLINNQNELVEFLINHPEIICVDGQGGKLDYFMKLRGFLRNCCCSQERRTAEISLEHLYDNLHEISSAAKNKIKEIMKDEKFTVKNKNGLFEI